MKTDHSEKLRPRLTSIVQMAGDCLLTLDDIETEEGAEKKLGQLEHAGLLKKAVEIDDAVEFLDESLTEINDGYYVE